MTGSPLRVLVAGDGVAALEFVLAVRALARERVSVELVSPASEFVARPWSVITPFTGVAAPSVPLESLLRVGVPHRRGAVRAVDAERHRVIATDGAPLGYDRLLLAPGARRIEGVPGALTFSGSSRASAVEAALRGARSHVLLVAPPGCGWTLPVYELALIAAHQLPAQPRITVVSYEPRPLDVFGRVASDALARLLDRAGVAFLAGAVPVEASGEFLVTADGRVTGADAVIALPRLRGVPIDGLRTDAHGFIPVDEHCRVAEARDVFAAGDATSSDVKQGGLATQQADAAAELIAAEAGAPVVPRPCRRVLRGVVLTGEEPLYLRRDLDDDEALARPLRAVPPAVARSGLWWPNGKIAGRYLTGFLASHGTAAGDRLADQSARPR